MMMRAFSNTIITKGKTKDNVVKWVGKNPGNRGHREGQVTEYFLFISLHWQYQPYDIDRGLFYSQIQDKGMLEGRFSLGQEGQILRTPGQTWDCEIHGPWQDTSTSAERAGPHHRETSHYIPLKRCGDQERFLKPGRKQLSKRTRRRTEGPNFRQPHLSPWKLLCITRWSGIVSMDSLQINHAWPTWDWLL